MGTACRGYDGISIFRFGNFFNFFPPFFPSTSIVSFFLSLLLLIPYRSIFREGQLTFVTRDVPLRAFL